MKFLDRLKWKTKQKLAGESRYYGDGGTIHGGTGLDIEVAKNGEVVAVWFRCQTLPFKAVDVDDRRAADMKSMYRAVEMPKITGVEVRDV